MSTATVPEQADADRAVPGARGLRRFGLGAMYLWAAVGTNFLIALHTAEVNQGSEAIKAGVPVLVPFLVPVWIATVVPLRWLRTGATLQIVVGVAAAVYILSPGASLLALLPIASGAALWLSWWQRQRHERAGTASKRDSILYLDNEASFRSAGTLSHK